MRHLLVRLGPRSFRNVNADFANNLAGLQSSCKEVDEEIVGFDYPLA